MRAIIAVVTAGLLQGAAGEPEAVKKEMALLQGQWSMVSGEIDTQALPDDYVKTATRVAKGDETTVMFGNKLFLKAKFTVDPAKKPKTIDYAMTDGPTTGKTQLGIYELDGDTVKFCFSSPGKERPADFTTAKGSGRTLSVWKRAKESKPAQAAPPKVRVVVLEGSPYQRGLTHGRMLKDPIHDQLRLWKADLKEQFTIDADLFIQRFLAATDYLPAIKKWTPELLEEIKGLAEGADVPFATMLAFQLPDEYWVQGEAIARDKCSSLGIGKRGNLPACVAQNMDVENYRDGFQVVLHIKQEGTGLEAFVLSTAGMIGLNGMNSRAVGICCNTLGQLLPSKDGLPVACIVRGVLGQRSEQEAVDFLRRFKHASGQNYVIGGPDKAYSFECSATKVTQFQPAGRSNGVWHTNHPLANDDYTAAYRQWLAKNDKKPYSTFVRFQCLEDRLSKAKEDWSVDLIKATLAARDSAEFPVSVPKGLRPAFTFASTIMVLSEKAPEFHIAPGPPGSVGYEKLTLSGQPKAAPGK
jgi:isopenicillin-N N-acyltransferase like protein